MKNNDTHERKIYPIRTSRRSWNISLLCSHECNENCEKILVPVTENLHLFSLENNPEYIDGKCSRYGKIENTAVKMCEYDKKEPKGVNGKLCDPDEIVIPDNVFMVTIDYPLTNSAEIEIRSSTTRGFTRKELLDAITNVYKNIYEEEERTATPETFSLKKICDNCTDLDLEVVLMSLEFKDVYSDVCCICYSEDEIDSDETQSLCKLSCNHIFHYDCIKSWIDKGGNNCPLCRSYIYKCNDCFNKGIIYYDYNGTVIPPNLRGSSLNRNRTNGKYGIFMHDFEDLHIEGLLYDRIQHKLTLAVDWRLNVSSL